jgi:hypothetical protein
MRSANIAPLIFSSVASTYFATRILLSTISIPGGVNSHVAGFASNTTEAASNIFSSCVAFEILNQLSIVDLLH